jgi:hypothetical protein
MICSSSRGSQALFGKGRPPPAPLLADHHALAVAASRPGARLRRGRDQGSEEGVRSLLLFDHCVRSIILLRGICSRRRGRGEDHGQQSGTGLPTPVLWRLTPCALSLQPIQPTKPIEPIQPSQPSSLTPYATCHEPLPLRPTNNRPLTAGHSLVAPLPPGKVCKPRLTSLDQGLEDRMEKSRGENEEDEENRDTDKQH